MAITKHRCVMCGKRKASSEYYLAKSSIFKGNVSDDGRALYPWCKDCMVETYDYYARFTDIEREVFIQVCAKFDIPFSEPMMTASLNTSVHPLKMYLRQLNSFGDKNGVSDSFRIPQFWLESERVKDDEDGSITRHDGAKLKSKWGDYDYSVLVRFEEKYLFLKNNYRESTNMHTEALLRYIRYSVLEEKANEDLDTASAKIYNDLANKAATAAKINPSQLSKADLTEGLNSFSELSLAIERATDVVRILPKFKYRPNDALDFTIWCYVNYERNLNGLPEVDYEEVYKFYDRKVEEYIRQYGDPTGIFSEDTTKNNRDVIKEFIKPPVEDGEK
jgi:hypothetical protein